MSNYKPDTNKWSMELIYDLLSIQGWDLIQAVKEEIPEEEQTDFWIAYEHYNKIQYWKTKDNG